MKKLRDNIEIDNLEMIKAGRKILKEKGISLEET